MPRSPDAKRVGAVPTRRTDTKVRADGGFYGSPAARESWHDASGRNAQAARGTVWTGRARFRPDGKPHTEGVGQYSRMATRSPEGRTVARIMNPNLAALVAAQYGRR